MFVFQELQEIFSRLILTDLSYSLEKKVEIDLWNFCFKNQISNLQNQVSVGNFFSLPGTKQSVFQVTEKLISWTHLSTDVVKVLIIRS